MTSVHDSHFSRYLGYITPARGDPTYSVLRAHLLFEEMFWAHINHSFPNPNELKGARLTFSQMISVVRATNPTDPDDWGWVALGKLNRIRNLLSHESRPRNLSHKITEYVEFYVRQSGIPLPDLEPTNDGSTSLPSHTYLPVDLVTVGLYYRIAARLGFSLDGVFGDDPSEGGHGAG